MIHSYMEHLERTKLQQHGGAEPTESTPLSKVRKERPGSFGIFPLPEAEAHDVQRELEETPGAEAWRYNNLSHPRSNTSLKDELADSSQDGSKSATPVSTSASDVVMASVDTPQTEEGDGLNKNLDTWNCLSHDCNRESSTPTKGIENLAFDRNTESLFEELSSAGTDLIGDVDEGADLLGMGREVEHLIQENTHLLETKNALNVVKNDLIARVDELVCEREALQGELELMKQGREKLEERNRELEEELRKARTEADESKQNVKEEEDSDVPTAQRKRFTRVEMARVLMERNQYKERLMELQEAVRWTEMIRASRENPTLNEKKKSSIWQFFSRLFSSSSGAAAKKPEAPVNVKYNAPTSHIVPSVKKRSSTLSQLPSDKSKAFDFLNEEAEPASIMSRREQKRAHYQQVKAHVQKEDGRVQAYGWSLPQKHKVASGGQTDGKMKNLPVPVYLRPLDEKDTSTKLWCAAGVNLSGGRTRDGGCIVGASVFYKDSAQSGATSPQHHTGSQSSLERLEQELKDQEKELQQQDELSSLVWICTSTQSSTKVIVIDANQPGNILENFLVCNSHVLCIASVPGARETDYPAGDEPHQEAGPGEATSQVGAGENGRKAGTSRNALDDITVVSCSAEGAVAIPQTAVQARPDKGIALYVCTGVSAEEAMEATENSMSADGAEFPQPGVYTEHEFTDPLGVQHTAETPSMFMSTPQSLSGGGVFTPSV
uniref:RH2 domain-containing protein n=1 Tax=Denticeps clupeoides TaxID=299321 RepID=A0AAY4EVX6_9TELE